MTSSDVNIIFEEEPVEITLNEDPVEIEMPAGQNGQSIHPRGAWSSSESYGYLDLVSYQGSSYVATKTVPVGTLPTDTGFWMLSAEKGLDGASEWGDITGDIANQTDLAQALAGKANVGDSYTKAETDTLLADKADADDVYSKSETDSLLSDKADSADVYTKTETDALLQDKAPVILNSASGSIASFTDGSALPVEDLKVSIEPVQDLHGYDNPWPAEAKGNLLPSPTAQTLTSNGITVKTDGLGTYTLSGTSTNSADFFFSIPEITLPSDGYTHIMNSGTTTANVNITYYYNNTAVGAGMVFSANNRILNLGENRVGKTINKVCIHIDPNKTVNITLSPMVMMTDTVSDFYPYSNICPISGRSIATVTRTGKNLWDVGIMTESTTWQKVTLTLPEGTYTMSSNIASDSPLVTHFRKASSSSVDGSNKVYNGHPITITITEGEAVQVVYRRASGTDLFSSYQYQLELGSSATSYEPYHETFVTIDLGEERFGGSLDVTTGMLTLTHRYVDLGTLTWANNAGSQYAVESILSGANVSVDGRLLQSICSKYPVYNSTSISNHDYGIAIANYGAKIYVLDINRPDITQIPTFLSGVQLVYKLATPFTVQLTPAQMQTLLGTNNIWADTGDVAVTYRADTKLFIEEQIAESETLTRKMIADSATADGKAPKSIATGDLIIVGDELRKATANIGNGSAITASNSTTATLADVIKALQ